MAKDLNEFHKFRKEMNNRILNCGHLGLKRFWALDGRAYEKGHWTRRHSNSSA